jgi:hypothetical protein
VGPVAVKGGRVVKPSALGYLILLIPEFHQEHGPHLWRVIEFGKNGQWRGACGPFPLEEAKRRRRSWLLIHKKMAAETAARSAKRAVS